MRTSTVHKVDFPYTRQELLTVFALAVDKDIEEAMDCNSEHHAPDEAYNRMLANYMQKSGGALPPCDPSMGEGDGSGGGEGDGDSDYQLATLEEDRRCVS